MDSGGKSIFKDNGCFRKLKIGLDIIVNIPISGRMENNFYQSYSKQMKTYTPLLSKSVTLHNEIVLKELEQACQIFGMHADTMSPLFMAVMSD